MSYILSQIIRKKLLDWNKKVFTYEDFEFICEREKVCIVVLNNREKGEYCFRYEQPVILIKDKLKTNEKTWVAFHELGHHFLHYPAPHRFSRGTFRKMDREANYFAAIALIPTYLVKSLTLDEILEDYNYPNELIKIRKEIYEEYKI